MKIIYYSYPFFADCDFPLVKALQDKGLDVHYYMPLHRNFQKASILEFDKPLRKMEFVKASQMGEMQMYRECVDLDRLYFIKAFPRNKLWIPSWCLWVYTLWHMKRQRADIIHIDWQYSDHFERFLFRHCLGKKKVLTVHDPIMHSGQPNAATEEIKRLRIFHWADHFILLNKLQATEFSNKYSISPSNISFSKLPNYDSISKILPISSPLNGDYILFFGNIIPYKGLEYLLDAMIKVHAYWPNLKLVVAGSGELYFNQSKYAGFDYLVWIHRYIGIGELVGLLINCEFVVCPYKDATQSGVIHTTFALGVPVVATNVGTLGLDVVPNLNGMLVPPCDIDSLADAIISLYGDKRLLQSMRENINSSFKTSNKNEEIANEYIKIYEDLNS